MRQREETFRRRLNEELDTQVRQARREIDDVIADLKAKTTAIAQEARRGRPSATGDTGAVRGDARAAVDQVVTRLLQPTAPPPEPPPSNGRESKVGDRVIVGGFGLEGVVTGPS